MDINNIGIPKLKDTLEVDLGTKFRKRIKISSFNVLDTKQNRLGMLIKWVQKNICPVETNLKIPSGNIQLKADEALNEGHNIYFWSLKGMPERTYQSKDLTERERIFLLMFCKIPEFAGYEYASFYKERPIEFFSDWIGEEEIVTLSSVIEKTVKKIRTEKDNPLDFPEYCGDQVLGYMFLVRNPLRKKLQDFFRWTFRKRKIIKSNPEILNVYEEFMKILTKDSRNYDFIINSIKQLIEIIKTYKENDDNFILLRIYNLDEFHPDYERLYTEEEIEYELLEDDYTFQEEDSDIDETELYQEMSTVNEEFNFTKNMLATLMGDAGVQRMLGLK